MTNRSICLLLCSGLFLLACDKKSEPHAPLPAVVVEPKTSDAWKPLVLANKYTMLSSAKDKPFEKQDVSPRPLLVQFPSESVKDADGKEKWFADPECKDKKGDPVYRNVSVYWRSDKMTKVSGINLGAKLLQTATGPSESNEIAYFFSPQKCYDGGDEYGWAYREKEERTLFYLCGDCNNNNGGNHWCQWPSTEGEAGSGICKTVDKANENCAEVKDTLTHKSKELLNRRIVVNPDGNFTIMIGKGGEKAASCTIAKLPDNQFGNLYGKDGYITLNAKKHEDTGAPPPALEVNHLDVRQLITH